MRVKQTARKSTTTPSSTDRVMNDPVRTRMSQLLHTKRKSTSATPMQGVRSTLRPPTRGKRLPSGGPGGKKIYMDQGEVKFKPRHKPNEMALKEIRTLQKTTDLLIPKSPFHRLVREITQNLASERKLGDLRYQGAALDALHEASECYLVQMFEDSYLCTIHAKRVTLFVSDMQLCRRLQRHRGFY